MKKLYCLFFLFFALSVRGEELSNSGIEIVCWNGPPIVSYNGTQYIVAGRFFEKMRVRGKKNLKYVKTPEEIKALLRVENNKKIKSRNKNIKKNASSENNKGCIIL